MAKKKLVAAVKSSTEPQKGLSIKVSMSQETNKKLRIKVDLLQDGQVISTDSDFLILK